MTVPARLLIAARWSPPAVIYGTDVFAAIAAGPPSPHVDDRTLTDADG